jgi:hypothetical protein
MTEAIPYSNAGCGGRVQTAVKREAELCRDEQTPRTKENRMANWVMVVVMVNGSFSNPIVTIPGFQFEEECRNAAEYDALQQKSGDTRVRDAFCLIQRGCRPNGQHEPMQD